MGTSGTPSTIGAMKLKAWPYPFWIAHRGAGQLAPENTLAAFRLGASLGYQMFECDVKLSADEVPFLLHDATLNRTTDAFARLGDCASITGGDHTWETLAQLDAGAWHSSLFQGEPLARLTQIAQFCLENQLAVNLEIKPTPGTGYRTGVVVAASADRLWGQQGSDAKLPPLLSSFDVEALSGARDAAAHLPRALLLDELWAGWHATAQALEVSALVCRHTLWTEPLVNEAQSAGWRCLSYTVNTVDEVHKLRQLGTHGVITDRLDIFRPGLSPT